MSDSIKCVKKIVSNSDLTQLKAQNKFLTQPNIYMSDWVKCVKKCIKPNPTQGNPALGWWVTMHSWFHSLSFEAKPNNNVT